MVPNRAAVLALLAAAYFYPLIKFLIASWVVPAYAKIAKNELLNHKLRENLVEAVRADPGIWPPELQKIAKASWSTLVYHLRVLEKNKVLSSIIDGRRKRFVPTETFTGVVDHGLRSCAVRRPAGSTRTS